MSRALLQRSSCLPGPESLSSLPPALSRVFSSAGASTPPPPNTGGSKEIDLRSALTQCVTKVRELDPENYAWAKLLSKDYRPVALALRALNIETAVIGDLKEAQLAAIRYQWWQAAVREALSDKAAPGRLQYMHPVTVALRAIHASRPLSKYWLLRLISTREKDTAHVAPPASLAALEAYAEGTHSALMYAHVEALGVKDPDVDHAASHLGKGLGMLTLLRGTVHHAQRRRAYLPVDLCSKHKVVYEKLYRGEPQESLKDVAHEVASLAKGHVDEAVRLVGQVQRRGLGEGKGGETERDLRGLFLPVVGCRNYLGSLEKHDFDLFHPGLAKAWTWGGPLVHDLRLRAALYRGL